MVTAKPRRRIRCRKCQRLRERSRYGANRRPKVCVDCERKGWGWCAHRKHVANDFARRRDNGIPIGYCRDCNQEIEARRTEERREDPERQAQSRGDNARPRKRPPGEHDIRKILRMFRDTNNITHVARTLRFSRYSVAKVVKENQDALAAIPDKKVLPPDPKPWKELSDDAKYALQHPLYLATEYLNLDPLDPWAEVLLFELLEAYRSDDLDLLLVNAAYGAGKSKVVTFLFVMWLVLLERSLGHEPTVLLGHRAEDKAKWYLGEIRRHAQHNMKLIEAFGRLRPDNRGATPWARDQIVVEPIDWAILREKEPTIAIGSYEGAVMSGHFKVCIWDDLIDEESSGSAKKREALEHWFDQTAMSRSRPGGLIVVPNARFGPTDLCHSLKSKRIDDELDENGRPKHEWRQLIFKAHYPELCQGDHGKDAKPWPEGCLLSPTRVPWSTVRWAMRRERLWRLSYQQEDVAAQGSLAEEPWFDGGTDSRGIQAPGCFIRELTFARRLAREPAISAVSVDPSGSNYWAVMHILFYAGGIRQVYRAKRLPLMAPNLLYREADGSFTGVLQDWFVAASQEGVPFQFLIVESRGFQKWLTQYEFVHTWLRNRNITLLPHDTNRHNKHDPVRGVEMLQPIYRDGQLWLPYRGEEESYIADAWKREATTWPDGDTWDLLMAHWFFEHNLPIMLGLVTDVDETPDARPPWAQSVGRPAWATGKP